MLYTIVFLRKISYNTGFCKCIFILLARYSCENKFPSGMQKRGESSLAAISLEASMRILYLSRPYRRRISYLRK